MFSFQGVDIALLIKTKISEVLGVLIFKIWLADCLFFEFRFYYAVMYYLF